ncbi:MAG: hypothetical protein LBE81_02975 [Azonexus sp.]|uniref:hypothetical protein n=1 Tax=Azonexus sp. TaxID=1872668 RepID=UPI00282CFDC6|nr:hypothetical protein [Azonexus sp.]MDR0775584.1 hypothetical protein [Azonexus sp.]
MRLTLLVPELLWPEPGDQRTLGNLPLPGFEWLAARAACRRQPAIAFETALARCFGLTAPAFGALRLFGEDGGEAAVEGHWLCADPVHLRFHHERVVLADSGAFDLTEDEARAFAAALNAEFADIGQVRGATARRWYLRLNPAGSAFAGASRHVAAPLSAVAGRRVDNKPVDHDATLTRWLNEVQMFLHGHPLNARREKAGLPPVNSLWLWGGGRLTRPQPGIFTALWSDHPLAVGLARAGGTPVHPLPEGFAGLARLASPGSVLLVVLDSLLPPVIYEDGEAWRHAWQDLEAKWFAPLRRQLGRTVSTLEIVAPTLYGDLQWSLSRHARWKFWQRNPEPGQTLAALASQFSESHP